MFVSRGFETAKKYTKDEINKILSALSDEHKYGIVLRAKGIVDCAECENFIHFDYVPEEIDIRCGSAGVIGRICVIGSNLNQEKIKELFAI